MLKVDPLNYVARLKSPIGVYLRREVLGKEAKVDAALKRKLHEKIVSRQDTNGSWNWMFVRTANNLWDLALLDYGAEDSSIKKGLTWLRSIQRYEYRGLPGFFYSHNRKDPRAMRSKLYGEFGPGCSNFYQTTYAVHLFHIFGSDEDKQVQTTVKSYLKLWGDKGSYCSAWCTLNVLRILIEHPLSRESKQVQNGLKNLAKRQTRTGAWQGFPFYHTFHALSRSDHVSAEKQLEKALPSLVRRQNRTGSWGKKDRESKTYLALDSLRNTGVI